MNMIGNNGSQLAHEMHQNDLYHHLNEAVR